MQSRNARSPLLLACLALELGGCAAEGLPPAETSSAAARSSSSFLVRGTLEGLRGYGLVLQNNGGDDIGVGVDGTFIFPRALADGSAYDVTVSLDPTSPLEHCSVQNAAGTVSGADAEVQVTCALAEFAVGGRVHGLDAVGLVLANNGDEEIALATDGAFVFFHDIRLGAPYRVTVAQEPEGVSCTVRGGAGTMGAGHELDVDVSCAK